MNESSMDLAVVDVLPVSPEALQRQVNAIQLAMSQVMKPGVHYGKIPGCGDKPALFKAGAEKIGLMFRLNASFDVRLVEMPGGHREYSVKCDIRDPHGRLVGQGVGSCCTLESKYRYRKGDGESTGEPVPKEYWKDKNIALLGGKGFSAKKIDGQWMIVKVIEKVENPDIADVYNTVLKMAKKRAHVDAIITCSAASDIFTQDIEEMGDVVAEVKASVMEEVPPPPYDDVHVTTADKLPPKPKAIYHYMINAETVGAERLPAAMQILQKAGAEPMNEFGLFVSKRKIKQFDDFEVNEDE